MTQIEARQKRATKEEECVTADDIRSALTGHRVMACTSSRMQETLHEEFIQRVLNCTQARKNSAHV